jgi:hypothetical protein
MMNGSAIRTGECFHWNENPELAPYEISVRPLCIGGGCACSLGVRDAAGLPVSNVRMGPVGRLCLSGGSFAFKRA